jgi:superfamily II DNA or RNA helicase
MKFTLKDYQDEAVHGVLANFRKARRRWHEDHDKQAFSLTAATGAGKTVMAAAAFEAMIMISTRILVPWLSGSATILHSMSRHVFA